LLLQRLFSSGSANADSPRDTSAAGQIMPGGNNKAKAAGASLPMLAGPTLSAMVSIQTQAPPALPSASDVASNLIDALDTNGDGVVSADELQKGLTGAGINADAASTIAKVDTDGDGKVSRDELTKAVQTDQDAHKAHHGGHGHRAGKAAESLISATDTDDDDALSLDEIAKALGKTGDADKASLQQAFSSIDTDGDGKLNQDELASAIQQTMANAARAYAQAATTSETAIAA
jgi:Ca2+-binding EF-hand superfamily protein